MLEGAYPRTMGEFDRWFVSEDRCREYLVSLRWPSGYRCSVCESGSGWLTKRGLMHCRKCGHQASVTAGTIFHKTRKPLRLWFQMMWWMTGQKNGASALGLQRVLGLGSYPTAWAWLHKLRRVMVRPGRDRLAGEVEVDETFVGGVEVGGGRRHLGTKALVVIAAQVAGNGIGRIRLKRIPDASAKSLHAFVKEAIEPGSTAITDGWESYEGLKGLGYKHKPRNISASGKAASMLLPRVHRVASLLKRWLLGTHQGRVDRKQLPYYLDEFTFRFNRRTSKARGLLFYRLAQQAVASQPVPFSKLVGGTAYPQQDGVTGAN